MYKDKWSTTPIKLNIFTEDDGVLCPIEDNILPFAPRRIFYVTNVPKNSERGNHAHFYTEQVLVCISGQILVKLYDGQKEYEYLLEENTAIYIPRMIWDSQIFLTGKDILLSICSTNYDKKDYIESREIYTKYVNS